MSKNLLFVGLLSIIGIKTITGNDGYPGLNSPYSNEYIQALASDTIPDVKERFGNFLQNKNNNPFDLKDPSIIEKNVEYDPETGQYIITEQVGNEFFRPPTYLTFDEYLELNTKQQEREYFNQLAGVSNNDNDLSALDPIAQFDVSDSMLDRLFGGNTIDIKPQGGIDLTFGVDYSSTENPVLIQRQSRQTVFDFDMDINMNVTGKIGEKLNLNTQYNTNATFDFDNQIKLDYNSELFDDDAIIKNIEAGNVSLPLRGSLIQGSQSLFGLKTELQFGHLRLTAIASQQNSQRENIQVEGGSQIQEFEVRADDYDENRHFFLSHYNREEFEPNLSRLPRIQGLFKLENIEVWITNDRNDVENVRDIVALSDLGEPERLVSPDRIEAFDPPRFQDINRKGLPDNDANDLYRRMTQRSDDIREIDKAVSILQSSEFGLVQAKDFEKVSARKLSPSEYNVHDQLGFISLNINVQPDQVLGIAFQYSYNGRIFKVGELSINTDNLGTDTTNVTPRVLFVKMLKSTTQRTDVPTWDLMMKNVYSIGAFQVSQEDFKLDVFYDDPGRGFKRFLPESNLAGFPLLRVFNLDNLNVQRDPQPDGIFDFVPGLTINTRNGRVMFPVLEPFGSSLSSQITEQRFIDKYTYPELYDRTIFLAREFPEKNRFLIKGTYKSSVSSEISLGAFNIPPGSVRVTAGGQTLREGQDYEIDYNLGRVRIINDAYLNSGVPINVSFEDNTLFGFQTKTMLGLRADYEVDENFNIGATFLQLFERPFTQKVNVGEDPINNKMYGLDLNLTREAPFLTKLVDAIPGIQTKAPSSINVSAEVAALKPGHSKAINQTRRDKGGVVLIDDFEGSASSFDLRQPANDWFLASVPQNDAENNNPLFPESAFINDVTSGANRAKTNWYLIDPSARGGNDGNNPYTSIVDIEEVFPNTQIGADQLTNIQTFNIHYSPRERGPYNFDTPSGFPGFSQGISFEGDSLVLRDPETRWGGVMRALRTNDFQSANIEFLEFWMLSPFLNEENPNLPSPDVDTQEGDLYINLGNISEDILRDSRMFFENGLPSSTNERKTDETVWSRVPIAQQITQAFDNGEGTREQQDLGLDGINNDAERQKYDNYIQTISQLNPNIAEKVSNDPANDDFRHFRSNSFPEGSGVITRYRDFNNPEGNAQSNANNNLPLSATGQPDSEDLNGDNTLNETESYFQYRIPLRYLRGNERYIDESATPFITDTREDPTTGRVWYRFRVPLRGPDKVAVGGIVDFRSIRFIRLYLKEFRSPVNLRFARMELVRNQWRRYNQDLSDPIAGVDECEIDPVLEVDAVNIEENSDRQPFNYVLPEGIQREQSIGVFSALQNEQSLSMQVTNLCDGEEKAVFKYLNFDFRVYERLKMFVHAESLEDINIPKGALNLFVRMGSDFTENYYEYEIPLKMSRVEELDGHQPNSTEYKEAVWPTENEIDLLLSNLIDAKQIRNRDPQASLTDEYTAVNDTSGAIKIRGNPNIGNVKVMMIGVRNPYNADGASYNTEVWLNELRLTGLDERGGVAALGRVDLQLADFGNVTVAGNYSSIGFGQIDQKVQERAREEIIGYDVAGNFELGKLLPEKWGLRLPFYAQFSKSISNPEFDPYDLDVRLKDKINETETKAERDSIRILAQDVTTIKSYNFTNVRKERTNSQKKPMPWDIENFSFSYSYSETERRDPIIELDQERKQQGAVDYSYSLRPKYIEPFKKIIKKDKYLKILKEFNFNPIPNTFNFSTIMDRRFATTKYRFTDLSEEFSTFFNKKFTWDRNYNLQWDLTKSLKFNFNATAISAIDEPDEFIQEDLGQFRRISDQERRDSIWSNIRQLGRPKNYQHNISLSYTAPIRYLPFMDWVQVRGNYTSSYSWTAASLNEFDQNDVFLGNIIQNSQNRSVTADLSFDRFYNKIGFLKDINRTNRRRPSNNRGSNQNNNRKSNTKQDDKKKSSGPSSLTKALVRPLLLIRKARFNYTEQFRTVIPGFLPETQLFGLSEGFNAPGWDFVAGLQPKIRTLDPSEYASVNNPNPDDWLFNNRGWITPSTALNQEVIQDYTQRYDANLSLEPFDDFKIELSIERSFTENHSQTFKDTLNDNEEIFVHAVPKNLGSMTISYFALSTLFDDSRDDIIDLFETFENNRAIISQRLGSGEHSDENLADRGYTFGYGNTQQDVLLPAFIAAYTGEDPRSTKLNVFDIAPKVNWRLSYNGLSKLPLFSELFSNFTLNHNYSSRLTVNSYNTGFDFLRTSASPTGPLDLASGNFFSRIEIPEVAIQEAFSPLISINAALHNGMTFNVDYKKSRNLAMNFSSNRLNETQGEELVIGFGYLIRDVNIGFLTGKPSRRKRKSDEDENKDNTPQPQRSGRGGQLQGRDLNINFDFSLRDDVTFTHILDQGIIEPTRGNYALSLSPSAEYQLNERLSLRAFFDYRRNVPKTSSGFPRTNSSGGVIVRFSLN